MNYRYFFLAALAFLGLSAASSALGAQLQPPTTTQNSFLLRLIGECRKENLDEFFVWSANWNKEEKATINNYALPHLACLVWGSTTYVTYPDSTKNNLKAMVQWLFKTRVGSGANFIQTLIYQPTAFCDLVVDNDIAITSDEINARDSSDTGFWDHLVGSVLQNKFSNKELDKIMRYTVTHGFDFNVQSPKHPQGFATSLQDKITMKKKSLATTNEDLKDFAIKCSKPKRNPLLKFHNQTGNTTTHLGKRKAEDTNEQAKHAADNLRKEIATLESLQELLAVVPAQEKMRTLFAYHLNNRKKDTQLSDINIITQ
jgi:hypothetical protein